MASKQAGWRVYKQQMGLLDHGDALWEPAPIYSYKRVKLGDVGYIRRGRFHLLFSAGCPLGSRQPGVDVPLTFEPLDVGPIIFSQPRLPGYLCTNTVKETGAGLGASVCTTPFLEPGASFSFELTEKQGAVLVTKYRTYREDIELESAFEEYTKRHYDSWVTFARNARHGNDIKPVLVTGVDMTRDFAMIAYSNNSTHLSSEFTTSVPLLVSASASAWGTWHTQGLVHTNCGPQLCSPPSSPETLDMYPSDTAQGDATPNEYNQCVFIRYYTMRWRALMFPRVIKAAAGPHDFGSGNNHDEALTELTVQSNSDSDTGSDSSGDSTTDYWASSVTSYESELEVFHNASSEEEGTFDAIAEYVFQNSEAEAVLIHHRDIAQIRERMPGAEISDIFSECQLPIEVDSAGVGRLVCRSHQQLAVTLPRTLDPSLLVSRHLLPDLLSDQSSGPLIHLNEEDTWVLSVGMLLLLATYSKSAETLSPDADDLGHVLDHLSRIPISRIILVGTAGIAGMFTGQSARTSESLFMPLSLLPSSWEFDRTLVLSRGVPEETLLIVLAEKHLGLKPTNSLSGEVQGSDDAFTPVKNTGKHKERRAKKANQRHSLPFPIAVEMRDESAPRPKSFLFKPRRSTQDEVEPIPQRGLSDALLPFGDSDRGSLRGNGWRHSDRSVTSNGGGSVASLLEPRFRLNKWHSSDQLSLSSNVSSSSVFTRFSGSTASTSLTTPPSGTTSKRSSRGSVLQREKRFSNIKVMDGTPWELDELPQPGTPKTPTTPTHGGGSSRRLMNIIPRRISSDGRSTHTTEHGVLPPPPKLHRRRYAASLTSLLRRRESSDETRSVDAIPDAETSSLGRRARFKRFFKDIFKA